jgi:hypothetical protein
VLPFQPAQRRDGGGPMAGDGGAAVAGHRQISSRQHVRWRRPPPAIRHGSELVLRTRRSEVTEAGRSVLARGRGPTVVPAGSAPRTSSSTVAWAPASPRAPLRLRGDAGWPAGETIRQPSPATDPPTWPYDRAPPGQVEDRADPCPHAAMEGVAVGRADASIAAFPSATGRRAWRTTKRRLRRFHRPRGNAHPATGRISEAAMLKVVHAPPPGLSVSDAL